MNKFFAVIALVAVVLVGTCKGQAKIPVSVYYESLCPDSRAFITQQLTPVLRGPLSKFVELSLIPYGKSTYRTQGSETEFECHHGPNECYGNKIHSCAIKNIEADSFQSGKTKQSKTVDFINCIMSRGFPDQTFQTERCGTENEIKNWKLIHECANTTEGSTLLKENGQLTQALNPALTSVPTILFRNHYDSEVQKKAVFDFQGSLCKELNPMPAECAHSGAAMTSITMASLTLVGAFFASRMF